MFVINILIIRVLLFVQLYEGSMIQSQVTAFSLFMNTPVVAYFNKLKKHDMNIVNCYEYKQEFRALWILKCRCFFSVTDEKRCQVLNIGS